MLEVSTEYEPGMHTVDTSGNINETWVNATARTLPMPGPVPPMPEPGTIILTSAGLIGIMLVSRKYNSK